MHPERQDLLKMVLEHPVRTKHAELTHPLMETASQPYIEQRKFVLATGYTCSLVFEKFGQEHLT